MQLKTNLKFSNCNWFNEGKYCSSDENARISTHYSTSLSINITAFHLDSRNWQALPVLIY